jgi:RNA polymerase sigma-70 factor (ECF subfamily)
VLLRATQRDQQAFAEIVSRYHLDLLRVAYVICGERTMAEDATQNAWHRAWRKLDQVRDAGTLRSWLVGIAANEARRLATRDAQRTAGPLPSQMPSTQDIASGVVAREDLRAALFRLDPADRQVIALRYLARASSDEIGGQLGITAEGARTRLARALGRLRRELDRG